MRNRSAFSFVLIIGIVNFFADLTYEGARGIVGPFLGSLGASAAVVGFVGGFGELIGYALRSVSGYFADKTRKYWFFAFTGYNQHARCSGTGAGRAVAARSRIGICRTRWERHPKINGGSHALARRSLDRRW